MLPSFLIVGTMKSGTSTLSDYLSLHEEIFIPKREVHFFDNDTYFKKGLRSYEKVFQQAKENQQCGEKTPTYSFLNKVPSRIYNMNPNIKLIWLFREPVARAYSNYWHAIVRGGEIYKFEDCIKNESKLMEEDFFRGYLERSAYYKQVEEYLKYFPKEQMHFLLFEEFISNPEKAVKDVLNFLNISSDEYKMPHNQLKSNQRKDLPKSIRLQYYSKKILGDSIPFKILSRINTRKVDKYPVINPELKQELKEYFYLPNKKLETITGKDLSAFWN